MSEEIKNIASAIAFNAKAIADRPNDWPDEIASRVSIMWKDIQRLSQIVDRQQRGGGSR